MKLGYAWRIILRSTRLERDNAPNLGSLFKRRPTNFPLLYQVALRPHLEQGRTAALDSAAGLGSQALAAGLTRHAIATGIIESSVQVIII